MFFAAVAVPRNRELVALGVALTTQCAYCIDVHTNHPREHGATRAELAEAAFIAAAVRAGGTLAHSPMALRLFNEGVWCRMTKPVVTR
jgi:AhpD family alkylhydroperoxidase